MHSHTTRNKNGTNQDPTTFLLIPQYRDIHNIEVIEEGVELFEHLLEAYTEPMEASK